jgi:hypothetical protein
MIIWSWLYGYYADEKAEPIVDFDELVKRGQAMAEYCKTHPDVDVIRAAQPIYDK